jgi:lipoprotein NlpI
MSLWMLCLCGAVLAAASGESADQLLKQAREALDRDEPAAARKLAAKAIQADPKNARAHLVLGQADEAAGKNSEAVADYNSAIRLDSRLADAYLRRGGAYFKLGRIKKSLDDFDHYAELRPDKKDHLWQRGISDYYAGRYEAGWSQFEDYQNVSKNDVENSVWFYLCLARVKGREKARTAILPIGKDTRVPMMEVYALFQGKAKPADVLAAAKAGKVSAAERKSRLFHAHLYLGLYYDSEGDKPKALDELTKAVAVYPLGGYMWDVARIHRERLRRELDKLDKHRVKRP